MQDAGETGQEETGCARCGACTVVCPAFLADGRESLSARGKLHLLSRFDPALASATYREILSRCLLCGACRAACPRGLDPPARFIEARGRLHKNSGAHRLLRTTLGALMAEPKLAAGLSTLARPLLDRLPADSGLRLRLGLPYGSNPPSSIPADTKNAVGAEAALNLFTGCYATFLRPDIARATSRVLAGLGSPVTSKAAQGCCGLATESSGDADGARRQARRNIAAFSDNSLPIVVACASCFAQLCTYPRLLADEPKWQERAEDFTGRLIEFSTLIASMIRDRSPFVRRPAQTSRVLWHDPCHFRFATQKITEAPREILRALPDLCLVEPDGGPRCCGQGGLFHLAQPELSKRIAGSLLEQTCASGAELVVSTCSGCLIQIAQGLQGRGSHIQVRHLALLLEEFLPPAA